jgi:hypothetical protein
MTLKFESRQDPTCVRDFSMLIIYMVKYLQTPFERVGYFLNTKVPFLCLM